MHNLKNSKFNDFLETSIHRASVSFIYLGINISKYMRRCTPYVIENKIIETFKEAMTIMIYQA